MYTTWRLKQILLHRAASLLWCPQARCKILTNCMVTHDIINTKTYSLQLILFLYSIKLMGTWRSCVDSVVSDLPQPLCLEPGPRPRHGDVPVIGQSQASLWTNHRGGWITCWCPWPWQPRRWGNTWAPHYLHHKDRLSQNWRDNFIPGLFISCLNIERQWTTYKDCMRFSYCIINSFSNIRNRTYSLRFWVWILNFVLGSFNFTWPVWLTYGYHFVFCTLSSNPSRPCI